MYGLYSRAAYDGARTVDLYIMSHINEGEHLHLEAGKFVKRNQKRSSWKLFWETKRALGHLQNVQAITK